MRLFADILLESGADHREWTVDGVLDGVGVLYGEPGVGKTFVACSIAASVASGRPWLGHRTHAGPVVYIAGEGGQETVSYRLQAAFDAIQCCSWEREDIRVYVEGPGLNLVAGPELLMAQIGIEVIPELIIVDTLSRAFLGDENKQEDMGRFVRSLDALRERYKCSVLVVHHTNKGGTIRGSSVLGGAVDVQLRLEAEGKKKGRPREGIEEDYTSEFFKITAEKLRERDASGFDCRFRFGTAKLWWPSEDEMDAIPMLDEFGEVQMTRIVMLPPDVVALMDTIAMAGRGILETGAYSFTFEEWYATVRGLPARGVIKALTKGIFKATVSKILVSPGLYGVEQRSPGVFVAAVPEMALDKGADEEQGYVWKD